MIRFILVCLCVILFCIINIPMLLVEWIIGKFKPDWKDRSSLFMVKCGFQACLFYAGVKVIVEGEENVPTDTAVVYVANHRSYFDILLTYVRVPRPTGYIAKKEMWNWILLRRWMQNLHCLFLDRENVKEGIKTILTAIDKAKHGISICIFPEGTRNHEPDTFLPFHDGSFKIAEKSGVPVVPITLVNTAAIFEDHFPKIKPATVVVSYGKPVYLKDLDKEDRKNVGAYFQKIISDDYFELKEKYADKLYGSKKQS